MSRRASGGRTAGGRQRKQVRVSIFEGSFGDVAVVYERQPGTGEVIARPVGFRYRKRSWRYWRAVLIALLVLAKRRLGR